MDLNIFISFGQNRRMSNSQTTNLFMSFTWVSHIATNKMTGWYTLPNQYKNTLPCDSMVTCVSRVEKVLVESGKPSCLHKIISVGRRSWQGHVGPHKAQLEKQGPFSQLLGRVPGNLNMSKILAGLTASET